MVIVPLPTLGMDEDVMYPAPFVNWLLFVIPLVIVIVLLDLDVLMLVPPAISTVSPLVIEVEPPESPCKFQLDIEPEPVPAPIKLLTSAAVMPLFKLGVEPFDKIAGVPVSGELLVIVIVALLP
tara:strand:- start:2 stop:373 length:372 start_codon:yes stop_codon:yes gene_type:complete